MIVAISYRFHDYQLRTFILDSSLLDPDHNFEGDLKKGLEGPDDSVFIDATNEDARNRYADDWGNLDKAIVKPPCPIEAQKKVEVRFE